MMHVEAAHRFSIHRTPCHNLSTPHRFFSGQDGAVPRHSRERLRRGRRGRHLGAWRASFPVWLVALCSRRALRYPVGHGPPPRGLLSRDPHLEGTLGDACGVMHEKCQSLEGTPICVAADRVGNGLAAISSVGVSEPEACLLRKRRQGALRIRRGYPAMNLAASKQVAELERRLAEA
jgi:hypothetical protein